MTDNTKALILIVDDNPDNIRVLGTALKSTEYNVSVALNGETALKLIEKENPDLVLLDVMMPGITGFQVCEKLKSNPKTQEIDVIFVTAAVNVEEELKGLGLGAVDYIHKPISIPIVQAKVALHLERAKRKKELQLKNEALAEVNRLRDDIERITHHDLKTPLNVIMGYSQLMAEDEVSEEEKQLFLKSIYEAGNKILYMINHSLDLYKMEVKTYQYTPELVQITPLMENILHDLQTLISSKKLTINIQHREPHPFEAIAEKHLSYSLFANLLRNAIEASPIQGVITITLHYENLHSVICIRNAGSVPEAIRATFFEKYTTASKKNGNGLGTYSAKLMTETQNGTIAMDTNDYETCLTVRLPRALESDAVTKLFKTA